jgi:uncharacterized delta-60 repeat protein
MRHLGRRRRVVAASIIGTLALAAGALGAAPTLDGTFGSGGMQVLAGGDDYAFAAVPTASGGTLAVGSSGTDSLLARVTDDGTPDTSLGPGGRLVLDLDPSVDALYGAAPLGGGVVVGGQAGSDSMIALLSASGAPDGAFGTSGVLEVDLGGSDFVRDVTIDDSGRIVAGAYTNGTGAVLRVLATGTLDPAFGGGDGVVPLGFDVAGVHALADGSILAAGTSSAYPSDFVVAKLDATGAPDTSFGAAGVATVDAGGSDFARGLAVDGAGRILVSGAADTPSGLEPAVARLLANGTPDAAFSGDGVVRPPLGGTAAIANDVASLADGSVAVVGADESAETAFALLLGADGSFDPADVTSIDMSSDLDGFEAAYLDGDRLLATGWANGQAAFARLVLDGAGPGGDDDTTAPTLTLPGAITVDATSPAGAHVSFEASAADDDDPVPTVSCEPAPDAMFPIGDTTVSCRASDASGNTADGSFGVHVRGAGEQLERLREATGPVTPRNLRLQLLRDLDAVARALDRGKERQVCNELRSFAHTADRRVAAPHGDELALAAQRIAAVLAC